MAYRQSCCFCRRTEKTACLDEIDMGLFICSKCASNTKAIFVVYGTGRSRKVSLMRNDGKEQDVETFTNWLDDKLAAYLMRKRGKIDRICATPPMARRVVNSCLFS